jgi:predicted RNase H-like HicB family nuclease
VEAPGFYRGILTDGDTLEQAKKMASEAVSGIIAVNIKHGIPFSIPAPVNMPDHYDIPFDPNVSFITGAEKTYELV